ncbi:IPT/TIG domain-containing protein [Streptomyces sp. NPDC086554]|uniref:IPT/TIG domain-containing protein n=1 Tax=Streptomyces sp. NPDC086554 TaxID=3154864 RepID=UPI00342245AE
MPELSSDPRPELVRFDPPSGSVDGGQQVTVHGNHLQYVIDIYFDHDACIIKEQQATKMVIITPAHEEGPVWAVAESSGGYSNGLRYRYTSG